MPKLAIICVDDELVILESLTEQLKRNLDNLDIFEIEAAESGEEALEILAEMQEDDIEVALIISDQIMPKMKGDELLINIHQKHPQILKIMMTGQADVKAVGNAVNDANLYRYIAKPWDETDLLLTVKEAIRSYLQDKKLEEQNRELRALNESLEHKVQERTEELRIAQEKSEQLLLNILPKKVAEKLKHSKEVLAEHFPSATVLFADIVEFTPLASELSPRELVGLLNNIFSEFDRLVELHGLEKIKTIGDSYMVAGGVPIAIPDHANKMADLALDLNAAIAVFSEEMQRPLQMRIGINTGSVVAGVIGKKKFLYDLWGDAVNIASRMEHMGEPGKIQVTEAFVQQLHGDRYLITERGEIAVKGKGLMKTYWLSH
jgi:adenylate cyclase